MKDPSYVELLRRRGRFVGIQLRYIMSMQSGSLESRGNSGCFSRCGLDDFFICITLRLSVVYLSAPVMHSVHALPPFSGPGQQPMADFRSYLQSICTAVARFRPPWLRSFPYFHRFLAVQVPQARNASSRHLLNLLLVFRSMPFVNLYTDGLSLCRFGFVFPNPGKEAIATVGVRIGRTAAHVALYLLSALLGGAPPQRALMGVALAAAALWAVTLRKVEALTRTRDKSRTRLPSPSPPPPPSKKRVAVGVLSPKHGGDKARLDAGSDSGASTEGRSGADAGLRRRETRGEVNGDVSFANGRHSTAAHINGNGKNGNGKNLTRKEL